MNEGILREYVKEILNERSKVVVSYKNEWSEYLERFAMLGAIGQNTNQIGQWGEEFAEEFFLQGYVNTNDKYKDHNFPLSDLITEPITKENLDKINYFDIKASATKKKKAASMSRTSSSIVKLVNYNKNNNNIAEMFRQRIEESPQKFIEINVGLVAFDYMSIGGEDMLRVQIYGPRKVKIKTELIKGKPRQVLIDEVPHSLSGSKAREFYGEPRTEYSLLSQDVENKQRRAKFLKSRDELKNKLKRLSMNDLEKLSQDINCPKDDPKAKCDYSNITCE